jgi:hypothetical protein
MYRKEEEEEGQDDGEKKDAEKGKVERQRQKEKEKSSYPEFLQPSVVTFGSSSSPVAGGGGWTDVQILTHVLTWSFSIRYDAVSQRRQKPSALLDVSVGDGEGDLAVPQGMHDGNMSWERMVIEGGGGSGGGAAYLPWGYRTVLVWLGVGLSAALRHILSSPPPAASASASASDSAEPTRQALDAILRARWDENKHSLLMTSLLCQYLFLQATRALNEPEYDKVTGKKTGRKGQGMNGRWRDPEGKVGRVLWRVFWCSTKKAMVRLFFEFRSCSLRIDAVV